MLSAELAAQVSALLESFEEAPALFEGLKLIQSIDQQSERPMLRIASGGNELNPGANELHTVFVQARSLLLQMSPRAFFKAIDSVGAALDQFLDGHTGPKGGLRQLRLQLDEFAAAFEKFSTNQTGKHALPVLRLGPRLLAEFEILLASNSTLLEKLRSGLEIDESEERITFYFSGDFSLEEIARKLGALNQIIETVASLVQGDAMGPSSRVLKLESGSLLFDLAVLKTVSSILKPFLSAVATFVYRNYTAEGRIRSIPPDAKAAIKSAMDVRAMLQKGGIDTTGMDNQLEAAGAVMAESVVMLLKNQAGFKMGDQDFRAPRSNLRLDRDAVPLELPSPRNEPLPPTPQ